MPPPRKLKTQKKARPEPCLLYWGCRRTRHLDRKLFREDCGGTAGFCRIGAKRRPCPQQPASSNSQPPPNKKVSWIPTPSPQSGRGRLWGNRRFLPHLSEAEFPPQRSAEPSVAAGHGAFVGEPQVPATDGAKRKSPPQQAAKEKGTFRCPFSFGAEDGTRTHTPKYWLLRPERLPFRHFRLFHFGPAHSQNSRPTSTRIIPFLALACQFPGLSPPFGGCLSTGVVLG